MQASTNSSVPSHVSIATEAAKLAESTPLIALPAKTNPASSTICTRPMLKINVSWPVPSNFTAIKPQIYVLLAIQGVANVLELETDHAPFAKKIAEESTTSWSLVTHLVLTDVQMVSLLMQPRLNALPAIPIARLASIMRSSAFPADLPTLE